MADLDLEGNPKKETHVEKKVIETPPQEVKNQLEIVPGRAGNELVIICKMLESINKNIAFIGTTIYNHLNPEKKNG
jgi:hypothetical protein